MKRVFAILLAICMVLSISTVSEAKIKTYRMQSKVDGIKYYMTLDESDAGAAYVAVYGSAQITGQEGIPLAYQTADPNYVGPDLPSEFSEYVEFLLGSDQIWEKVSPIDSWYYTVRIKEKNKTKTVLVKTKYILLSSETIAISPETVTIDAFQSNFVYCISTVSLLKFLAKVKDNSARTFSIDKPVEVFTCKTGQQKSKRYYLGEKPFYDKSRQFNWHRKSINSHLIKYAEKFGFDYN